MTDEPYIQVEEAAAITGLTARQVHRLGETGKLRRRRSGKRYLYHLGEVQALAADAAVANRPPPEPRAPKQELMPAGQMLEYLRERDNQLEAYQRRLEQAAYELAQLRTELQNTKLLADKGAALDERMRAVEAERDALRRQLEEIQRQQSWWRRLRRLFGK